MISLIEFRKDRLIENRKVFQNKSDVENHVSFIKNEILISNKEKRMVELKNWLNYLN
jgi:GMP synthase (glutamine-hydrolysing)